MSQFDSVKDSGAREEFATGSRRDTRDGKGRYELVSPIVMQRDAVHLENGANKYGDRNWEKGQPLSRYIDSALRHTYKLLQGFVDEDHASAARWNLAAFIHTQEMIRRGKLPKELDDMPNFGEGPQEPEPTVKVGGVLTKLVQRPGPDFLLVPKDSTQLKRGANLPPPVYNEYSAARVSDPRTLP
jgi:hypothetical protein